MGSFITSSARFGKFDAGNVILFQIKVFAKNINYRDYASKVHLFSINNPFLTLAPKIA